MRSKFFLSMSLAFLSAGLLQGADWPQYPRNPFVIPLEGMRSGREDVAADRPGGRGGLLVHDLDGDGLLDYLLSRPGEIAAFAHDGRRLWLVRADLILSSQSEYEGLPGLHAPGAQAGDADGDGRAEVLFLSPGSVLQVLDGATGKLERSVRLTAPEGFPHWEHAVLGNLRGQGDRDVIVQTTNADGYRMGRFVAAYALEENPRLLWSTDRYIGCAHNGLRVADLDGDGRDEVLGATLLRPDGTFVGWTTPSRLFPIVAKWRKGNYVPYFKFPHYQGHMDSVFVEDVRPDSPGLEVVALQEGSGMKTWLYGLGGVLWESHYNYEEPQNAALGDFDPARLGLEVWCRSRHDTDQTPWVFSSTGALIATWKMKEAAPADWTAQGIEAIASIHWDGGPVQYLAAKERHEAGDVAVVDAMTGRFLRRFPEKAERVYVADVSGDWREEIVVVTEDAIRVHWNAEPSLGDRPRLWENPHYRRSKTTHNYYSP